MFCPECGAKNEDTAKFCIKCGKRLNYPLEDVTTPSDQINNINQPTAIQTQSEGKGILRTSYIMAGGTVIGIFLIILVFLHYKGSTLVPWTIIYPQSFTKFLFNSYYKGSTLQSDNSQPNESDNINNLLTEFQNYYNSCDLKGMKTLFREGFDQKFMAYMEYLCARNGAPYTSTLEMTSYHVDESVAQSEERILYWVDAYETIKAKSGVEATVESDTLHFYINKRDGYKIEKVTGLSRLEDY